MLRTKRRRDAAAKRGEWPWVSALGRATAATSRQLPSTPLPINSSTPLLGPLPPCSSTHLPFYLPTLPTPLSLCPSTHLLSYSSTHLPLYSSTPLPIYPSTPSDDPFAHPARQGEAHIRPRHAPAPHPSARERAQVVVLKLLNINFGAISVLHISAVGGYLVKPSLLGLRALAPLRKLDCMCITQPYVAPATYVYKYYTTFAPLLINSQHDS